MCAYPGYWNRNGDHFVVVKRVIVVYGDTVYGDIVYGDIQETTVYSSMKSILFLLRCGAIRTYRYYCAATDTIS